MGRSLLKTFERPALANVGAVRLLIFPPQELSLGTCCGIHLDLLSSSLNEWQRIKTAGWPGAVEVAWLDTIAMWR